MAQDKDTMQKQIDEANKKSSDALTEKRKIEFENETRAYREKLQAERAAGYAADKDKLARKHISHTEQGQDVTYWDEVLKHAENAINKEQAAYNDWRSAMTSLISMLTTMNKALAISFEQTRGEFIQEKLGISMGSLIKEKMLHPLKDKLMDKIKGQPSLDLPNLQQHVGFKDGKVDIRKLHVRGEELKNSIKKDKNGNETEVKDADDLNKSFKTLVNMWLLENGYKVGPNGTHVDVNGAALDKAKFDALQNDPQTSLAKFLSEKAADLKYQEQEVNEEQPGLNNV